MKDDLTINGINVSSTTTAIGAAAGILFAMSRKSGFFATAGFALLGAISGAYLGYMYEQNFNKK